MPKCECGSIIRHGRHHRGQLTRAVGACVMNCPGCGEEVIERRIRLRKKDRIAGFPKTYVKRVCPNGCTEWRVPSCKEPFRRTLPKHSDEDDPGFDNIVRILEDYTQ